MRSFETKGLAKSVGLLALDAVEGLAFAYLSYWLALVLDRVLVQVFVYPLFGASLLDWRISPFRISIENAALTGSGPLQSLLLAVPLILEMAFLGIVARKGPRLRSAFARIWLHFAGLWIVLLLASQVAALAYLGRGQLARLLVLTGVASNALPTRIGITSAATLLLLAAGGMCCARLFSEGHVARGLHAGQRWLGLLLLILPVLVVLAGTFGFALRWLGTRAILFLIVPGVFCLALALVGLRGRRLFAGCAPSVPTTLGFGGGVVALCLAAVLYVGLQHTPGFQRWLIERSMVRLSSPHYEVLYEPGHLAAQNVTAITEERERLLVQQAGRLNVPTDWLRLRLVLYPDFDSQRKATGSFRPYGVEGATIRAVLDGYIRRVDPAADATALLNAAWGPPGSPLLGEWVARWLAAEWRGRSLEEWTAQIETEEGHYTLAQLIESRSADFLSPLVRTPLGAAWVSLVFERFGLEGVRRVYGAKESDLNVLAATKLLGTADDRLEQQWLDWPARLQATSRSTAAPKRKMDETFFFRGVSFSHEGWGGGRGGYVSAEATEQLRLLRAMSVNAIAVVPYGFVRDTTDETISYTLTDESDEDLSQVSHVAHQLGMKVMLKPQLWVSWGKFTGEIHLQDPVVRANWMRSYRQFILHYARLAELEQFDLLCIGNELEGATIYEEDWRRLIGDVRRVYRGPITYAANWGREFESVRFWDALDYAGLNNYYPLAATSSVRVEDLLPGALALAEKIEAHHKKWRKPILFTEVGYPSVRGAAAQPWAEDSSHGISLEEQAASYEALFQAFAGRPWFRGMFWWKWPSNGRGGGPKDASFTPLGKTAAEVLRAWYTRLGNASRTEMKHTP